MTIYKSGKPARPHARPRAGDRKLVDGVLCERVPNGKDKRNRPAWKWVPVSETKE